MKLTITKRAGAAKGEAGRLRKAGEIPAILYGKGSQVTENGEVKVKVKTTELQALLRAIPQGRLPTTLFELSLDGTSFKALVKNIHYHPSTYAIEHIDFMALSDDRPVSIKVPIELTGVSDCPGVKLGGVLRQVVRSLAISCLPRDIPSVIQVDVRSMDLGGAKKLSELPLPANVRPLAKMNEVAVVIAKAKTA